jgi:hypothetical protein
VRTTLTIDEEVAALLRKEMRKTGEPLKRVINRAILTGLTAPKQLPSKPFKVTPINLGLPHYDKVEDLLEHLEGPDYR